MGVIVARHINGITLNNELEYILNPEGGVLEFDNKEQAEKFLYDNGFTDEDIRYLEFIEMKNE